MRRLPSAPPLPLLLLCVLTAFRDSLCTAPLASAAAVSPTPSDSVLISDRVLGPRFDGVGAISGGGATSRLLPSYAPSVLSEVLDFLFLPDFGASLHWLKVEIGGEALATEGSEATHARSLQELQRPNYDRGYEWRLMAEARRRNPAIGLYGLSWTWPGFLAGSSGGSSPWADPALTANYSISWVRGAERRHGLRVDVLGVWNERPVQRRVRQAAAGGAGRCGLQAHGHPLRRRQVLVCGRHAQRRAAHGRRQHRRRARAAHASGRADGQAAVVQRGLPQSRRGRQAAPSGPRS